MDALIQAKNADYPASPLVERILAHSGDRLSVVALAKKISNSCEIITQILNKHR